MTGDVTNRPGETIDVLVYVQHLLGIGHLRRAAVLVRSLDQAGLKVVLVSGGMPVEGLDIGAAGFVQLPPARAMDETFKVLADAHDQPVDEAWMAVRRDQLCALYHRLRPRVVIIELFPFGRRKMRFELLPLLDAARASHPRPQILCSLRDVLVDDKNAEKTSWMIETFERYFDLVLLHGDPEFLPLERSFSRTHEIANRLRYTGYVLDDAPLADPEDRAGDGEVIVSMGGGAVGAPLVEAALAIRSLTPLTDVVWRVLIGPNMPEAAFQAIAARAPADTIVERARPDFRALLAGARLSISLGGYNTVLEVLAAGIPAVVVPYSGGTETEQTLRARLLAERELLTVVHEADLSPSTLAAAVRAALAQGAEGQASRFAGLDTSGADKTVRIVRERLAMVTS
jgi:predicted glycosyltransferase